MARRADRVYLIHFDEPIGDVTNPVAMARHYTGSTPDLARRMGEHQRGSDAKIMQAVRRAGIGWVLARTWEGGRDRERQLKQHGAARRCPVCKGKPPQAEIAYRAEPVPRREPTRWTRPPEPEPDPLEDFIVARLEPAEAAALVRALDDAQRAAWQHTAPGPDHESRFTLACDLARLSGGEARAARRMAEAREIHAAEQAAYQEQAARQAVADAQEDDMELARWCPAPEVAGEAAGPGGSDRGRAYESELTTEGRQIFRDRGYLADPQAPEYDPAVVTSREAVVSDLAAPLGPAAAARMWQAAYQGAPGLTEYRVPDREAG